MINRLNPQSEQATMSDKLFECALRFKKLLDIQYVLTFGHKGKTTNLTITFNEENFCHLAGLHKLKDMNHLKRNATINFNKILDGSLTYKEISCSAHIHEIEDRLRVLSKLEFILDHENTNWKYCQENSPFYSKIRADFLIEHKDENAISYIFIKENNSECHHSCNSCFEYKRYDYTKNQTRLTLLEKKKLCIRYDSLELLYRRNGYIPIKLNKKEAN